MEDSMARNVAKSTKLHINVSRLSGDLGVAGNNSDNCYHVIYNFSMTNSAVLDGFTISGGNANNGSPFITNQFGGGMYNLSSSATVANCTFTGNSSSAFGGGAIMNPALIHPSPTVSLPVTRLCSVEE
jgi:hypothetical protein